MRRILGLALFAMVVTGCKTPECPPLSGPWKGYEKASGLDVECCARDNTFAKHGHYTGYYRGTRHKAMEGVYADEVRVGLWHAWKKSGTYDVGICYDDKGTQVWRESDEAKAKARSCP